MSQILLVEDDVVTSMVLTRALEKAGHEVEVAKNGLAAVEMLANGDFAVLITDMMMPRLGGEELCEFVRADERNRDLPIVVTTGVVDPEKLSWVEMYHAVEVHPKPLRLSEFVDRIDQLTQR